MISITTYSLPNVTLTVGTDKREGKEVIAVGAWDKDKKVVVPPTEAKNDDEAMDLIMKAITYGY